MRTCVPACRRHRECPRLIRSLVTPVDGQGRGLIAVSVSRCGERRTAAFLCDVRLGIRDVVGETEPESAHAGGLIDELETQSDGDCARDVPELALGLLAGSLMLGGTGGRLVGERLAFADAWPGVSAGTACRRRSRDWTSRRSASRNARPGRGRARRVPVVARFFAVNL